MADERESRSSNVWLNSKTPQNFHHGRDRAQAQVIAIRANLLGRQLKIQKAKPKPTPPSSRSHTMPQPKKIVYQYPSPTTLLQDGNPDPFQSWPVPLTALNHDVIKSTTACIVKVVFPAEIKSGRGWKSYLEQYQRSAFQLFSDEAGMHAKFSYLWAMMARLNSKEREICLRYSRNHEVKAIQTLRPIIAGIHGRENDLKKILHIVMVHCGIALVTENRDGVAYHQNAMRQLVGSIGGLSELQAMDKDQLVCLTVRVALETRTRTVFDPNDWDSRRLVTLSDDAESPMNPMIKSAHEAPWNMIFEDIKELESIETAMANTANDLRWCYLRRNAIKARVGNLWCDFTEPTNAMEPVPGTSFCPTIVHHSSVDMCLCMAVQSYVVLTSEYTTLTQQMVASVEIFHVMMIRCVRTLGIDLARVDNAVPGAKDLLWMLSVGAVVETHMFWGRQQSVPWIVCDIAEIESSRFVMQFGLLALNLGFRSYEDVVSFFQQQYVYNEGVQGSILRGSFRSAMVSGGL